MPLVTGFEFGQVHVPANALLFVEYVPDERSKVPTPGIVIDVQPEFGGIELGGVDKFSEAFRH